MRPIYQGWNEISLLWVDIGYERMQNVNPSKLWEGHQGVIVDDMKKGDSDA